MNPTSYTQLLVGDRSLVELCDFLKKQKQYSAVYILSDTRTAHYWMKHVTEVLAGCNPVTIVIESGESRKTMDTCALIWKRLLDAQATRNSLLINLGGGVITDLGGFVASTYKRGIDFVNVPTTLLGMVDAAWGGKSGVNFNGIKNQVGAFAHPVAVVLDVSFLTTLSESEKLSGFAEMAKHALIDSEEHWRMITMVDPLKLSLEQVQGSLNVKQRIVAADPNDNGVRMALNFGHTFGHAIEACIEAGNHDRILHGEAIAWGMVAEAWLSVICEGLPQEDADDIQQFVMRHYDPATLGKISSVELIRLMQHDKKNHNEKIRFTLLHRIGGPVTGATCEQPIIEQAIDRLLELASDKQTT